MTSRPYDPDRPYLRIEQLGCLEDAMVNAIKELSYRDSTGTAATTAAPLAACGILCGEFNFAPAGVEEKALPTGWGGAVHGL